MARPETHDHIPTYAKMPTEVASFTLDECAELPMFLTTLLLAAEVAGHSGQFETAIEHGVFKIRRPKTEQELDTALKSAQNVWDNSKQHYENWRKVSTHLPPKYAWHQVRSYYRSEGLDPIPELETPEHV